MNRKICVITGSRADYGLLKLVMKGIQEEPSLTLQIIATGMHLSPSYGNTYQEIEDDGFVIDERVDCLSLHDTPLGVSESIGRALVGCSLALERLKPDLVLVLGDRFEIFAACTASLLAKIPIGHIHGGEITSGSFDESFRHSISKMSNLHFVATEACRKRVIQLGENPKTVFEVGGLGVDSLKTIDFLSKNELEKTLGIKFASKSLLVTFHPATLEDELPGEQIGELLAALTGRTDTTLIFTMPNADPGGHEIRRRILDFVERNDNSFAFESMGHHLYLSCMRFVDGVVGNSSSGILEAPSLKVGTVNIGSRQLGREQASSIINSSVRENEIREAIDMLYSEHFRFALKSCKSPYGEGGASNRIADILVKFNLKLVHNKYFYDLPESKEVY